VIDAASSAARPEVSDREVATAMWRGDEDWLRRYLRCQCCCHEHSYDGCPARRWHGCLGQGSERLTRVDVEAWFAHYARRRGMTRAEFFPEPPGRE
jgi:hypothetical protein